MKTFETEYKELYNWLMEKKEEYFENERKEQAHGFDSKAGGEFTKVIWEYNKKLLALKAKYGIE